MWPDLYLAIAVFVFISAICWFAVKYLINVLLDANQVDQPNDRTMHSSAVPRGGGIVISVAMIAALSCAAAISSQPLFYAVFAILMSAWTILSWCDDRVNLTAKSRFIAQAFFAIITIAAYGWVSQLVNIDIGIFGAMLTFIGILWMTNLYNFMDGIDGLAASQAVIGGLTFAVWFYLLANPVVALICLVVAAASYGFLLHNWQPARIFMGDVGSISLGAFFATCMILAATRHNVAILSSMLIFGFFILDASTTILLRIKRKEAFWQPHKKHLYQRLVNSGLSHQTVTLGSILLMLLGSALATLSLKHHAMIGFSIATEIAVYAAFYLLCRHRENIAIK